jgi:hypothetical protein
VLALLRGNTTFRLISVKPFYIGNIKVITNNPEPEPVPEPNSKAKGNIGIIPPAIPTISLKYNRGRPRKTPDITVFLQDDELYKDSR